MRRSGERLINVRIHGCVGKVKHRTQQAANDAAVLLRTKGIDVDVYPCGLCLKWHVGKSKTKV